MSEPTYEVIEIVGVSQESVEEAIRGAIGRAGETLKGLAWFEVGQIRGTVADGDIGQFQVVLKLGFRALEEGEPGKLGPGF
jgi:flavin-binding protein dodecin